MTRREFLVGAGALALSSSANKLDAEQATPKVTASRLPKWHGFNLLEKFTADQNKPYREEDFDLIAELGFDFVRLPMSYRCWTDSADALSLREDTLKEIDRAVEYGRKRGIHVNLNFHRAPGYCVNPPKEPIDLWTDEKALDICGFHWAQFAERYRGIPSSQLSFDLLNEPGSIAESAYVHVVTGLVERIRAKDPSRLIIADGLMWGTRPVPQLASLKIAQSTRGYNPMRISHFRAGWVGGSDKWPTPDWPLKLAENDIVDKERIRKEMIVPWKELEQKGVGIHVGEWGAFNQTPHDVVLKWMADMLDLWKEAGWGWAMWNFRGSFGPVDSDRADVNYENIRRHKVDRKMLELLRAAIHGD
jgi:endoglucanase